MQRLPAGSRFLFHVSPAPCLLSMSELHAFLRRFKPFFFHAGLFSFFINLALLAPSLYLLQVFDRVLTGRSLETLAMLTLITVFGLVVMLILDYLRGQLLQGAGAAIDRMLGGRVIEALVTKGSQINRTEDVHGLRDVAALRSFFGGSSILALFDLPWTLFYVALIFLFHPLLGLVAVLGAGTLLALAWADERLNRPALERNQNDARYASHFIDQGLANAEAIVALGMAPTFVRRWENINEQVLQGMASAGRRMGGISSLSRFVRQLIQVAMLATGAYLVVAQHMSAGIMVAATIILGRALAPVETLIANWKNFVQARLAFSRLKAYFECAPTAVKTELPPPSGRVNVERVGLLSSIPDRPIIRHVNFELEAGETLAIVGPSASGKSSLARLIVGIWQPSAGTVRLDGASLTQLQSDRIGPFIGYLPQSVGLFPGTVSENIARLGEVDSAEVLLAARRAHVHDLILDLPQGYDTTIGAGGHILSGGQMQRIGLARALYGSPRLVVLDEPNANLDTEGEASLLQAIRELRQDKVTVILVTHKPSLLADIDRILVMNAGRMELFGPRDEILARIAPPAVSARRHQAEAVSHG